MPGRGGKKRRTDAPTRRRIAKAAGTGARGHGRTAKDRLADAAGRAPEIVKRLKARFPQARCSLEHQDPLELLVATILSAQCTDARVNIVTKDLFRKYRTAADYALADPAVFEREIKSTGFYRNKTKSILGMAHAVMDRFGGKVPSSMEDLVTLPGVGRKTANVVLGNAFGKNEGIVVDTHVGRIAKRLRLSRHEDPEKIEQDLMRVVSRREWTLFPHLLIHHGRAICQARKPQCEACPVNDLCPSREAYLG